MSEQYPGGFITRTPPEPNGSTGRGLWTLSQAAGYKKQGLWPTVPAAPTIGTATAGVGSASVAFTAPSNTGSAAITSYTATSSPGGFTGTAASSPITVSGLTAGSSYTFTVTATNGAGTGPASAASNSITALAPNYVEDVMSTYLWTGNDATQIITNGVNLSANGGLVWIKARTATYSHILSDTVRGTGKFLSSNNTDAQGTDANDVTAFNTTGFTIGNNARINNPSFNYVGWTFREQTKFFDIVTFTGNGTAGRTVSHNLGSVPGCIIVRQTNVGNNWAVYHRSIGATNTLYLNANDASGASNFWNSTTPTSSIFTVGSSDVVNGNGNTYIAYLFAHDAGGFGVSGTDNVITCGSFTTDGSGAASVTLGYEPQWVMQKRTDSSTGGNWYIADNMRGMNVRGSRGLFPNLTDTEETTDQGPARINATGFTADRFANATYIYVAVRRGPMAVPTDSTKVFKPVTATAANNLSVTAGFPVDLAFVENRVDGINRNVNDRLRGGTTTAIYPLESNSTGSETGFTYIGNGIGFTNNSTGIIDNFTNFNQGASSMVYWMFRRAPSYFDEVCYTGTGSARTVTHNLAAVPELMIVKSRSQVINWIVWSKSGTQRNDYCAFLNGAANYGSTGGDLVWGTPGSGTPSMTSTTFSLGDYIGVNNSGSTYVAWLFATAPGVSKVGTYTGTGTTQVIDCGFTAGSRFIMIKRIDSTGDWYVWDSARGIIAGNDPYLLLNSAAAEVTNTDYVDTATTGFEISSTAPSAINANGGTFIFLAIA